MVSLRPLSFSIHFMNKTVCYIKKNRKIVLKSKGESTIIKVNLGCGLTIAAGWLNIDGGHNAMLAPLPNSVHKLLYPYLDAKNQFSSSEFSQLLKNHKFIHHDLGYGIPLPEKSADFIYTSHFLEHLFKKDAIKLLQEAFRVLKNKGIVRICIPDLSYALKLGMNGEKEKMLNYFFCEDSLGEFARHRYMYDFDLLNKILTQIGFAEVKRCEYREGRTPDIHILDNRPEETLYVEAIK